MKALCTNSAKSRPWQWADCSSPFYKLPTLTRLLIPPTEVGGYFKSFTKVGLEQSANRWRDSDFTQLVFYSKDLNKSAHCRGRDLGLLGTVFNAGATLLRNGETLLMVRVEDRRGSSHLTAARSRDGKIDWAIDSEPTFLEPAIQIRIPHRIVYKRSLQ
jgi:hypothetical protein